MNDHQAMKVTWIDPDGRALYASECPEGGFAIWAQKGKEAPRKLRGGSIKTELGYETFEVAQEALSLYISQRKDRESSYRYGSWEIVVNGKRVTEDEYHEMCRRELAIPQELPPNAPVALANIEYRIALHIQGAYENVLEVGRCLNEAKDSELVPHGEWEGWVRRNTDMTERQAQRLMQAARSVSAGSMMERLPITKIQALLAVPEPERELMAKKVADEGLSLRELQDEIKARKMAEADVKILRQQIAENKKEAERSEQNLRNQLHFRGVDIESLEEALKHEKENHGVLGISPEAQAEIDRLRAELTDTETYAAQQADLRQKAQQELLDQQTQIVRGDRQQEATVLSASALASAVRVFIGTAGVLPHMGKALETMSQAEKEAFRQQVDIISRWTDASEQALNMICSVAIIEEQGDGV